MNIRVALAALAVTPALAFAAPAQAQAVPVPPPATAVTVDAHVDLYNAMSEGVDQEIVMQNVLASIRAAWNGNTQMVIAERQFPGLFSVMIDAAEPIIRETNALMVARFAPEYAAALRPVVTADEARELAAFYRSPMGMKIKSGLIENMDYRQTIAAGMDSRELSESNIRSDLNTATAKAIGGLTAEDFAELDRLAATKPVLQKLNALGNVLMPVRMRMEQASMAPEYQKKLEVAMQAAAQKHVQGK